MTKSKLYIIQATTIILAILLGFSVGTYSQKKPDNHENIRPLRQVHQNYTFINPLLAYDFPKSNDTKKYQNLTERLKQSIDTAQSHLGVTNVSIFFKDLASGEWVGINENEHYSPASLLKVPLMIAYFKIAESKPDILKQQIIIDAQSIDDVQNIKPSHSIELGKTYTALDLIGYMIKYSDNNAAAALRTIIDKQELEHAYTDLGFTYPGDDRGDIMSVTNYALYFRLLYNATYLNQDLSESALKILSETDYKDGLVAGIPSDILVAHKFGERKITDLNSPTQSELHDCGIVYVKNHNYILCVMTKGKDTANLANTIRDISQQIYSFETQNAN